MSNALSLKSALGLGALMVFAAIAGWYSYHHHPADSAVGSGPRNIAILDAVRLVNAERAAIPQLAAKAGGDPSLEIIQIGKSVAPTIEKIAGKGTLVVLKQAVVYDAGVPDITDQVLDALGLPKNAPTVNMSSYLESAPTTSALSGQAKSVNDVVNDLRARNDAEIKQAKKESANNALP